jgi:hypothetical protein
MWVKRGFHGAPTGAVTTRFDNRNLARREDREDRDDRDDREDREGREGRQRKRFKTRMSFKQCLSLLMVLSEERRKSDEKCAACSLDPT